MVLIYLVLVSTPRVTWSSCLVGSSGVSVAAPVHHYGVGGACLSCQSKGCPYPQAERPGPPTRSGVFVSCSCSLAAATCPGQPKAERAQPTDMIRPSMRPAAQAVAFQDVHAVHRHHWVESRTPSAWVLRHTSANTLICFLDPIRVWHSGALTSAVAGKLAHLHLLSEGASSDL